MTRVDKRSNIFRFAEVQPCWTSRSWGDGIRGDQISYLLLLHQVGISREIASSAWRQFRIDHRCLGWLDTGQCCVSLKKCGHFETIFCETLQRLNCRMFYHLTRSFLPNILVHLTWLCDFAIQVDIFWVQKYFGSYKSCIVNGFT